MTSQGSTGLHCASPTLAPGRLMGRQNGSQTAEAGSGVPRTCLNPQCLTHRRYHTPTFSFISRVSHLLTTILFASLSSPTSFLSFFSSYLCLFLSFFSPASSPVCTQSVPLPHLLPSFIKYGSYVYLCIHVISSHLSPFNASKPLAIW